MAVGFIGLGIMGGPMAENLLEKGHSLLVYDVDPEAVERAVRAGAKASCLKEIGEQCRIVFTILPKGDVVKEVLFGKDGVAQGLAEGSIVCDMSSVTPVESRYCHERLKVQGAGFVDAPVSGGEPGARMGTLAFMAGGEEEDLERLRPYLEVMGSSVLLVGGRRRESSEQI